MVATHLTPREGGGSPSLDPVGNGAYNIETSCAQGTENCQSNFEAAEKAIKDHAFTNENVGRIDQDSILANHAITPDQEDYLTFLFQHRKAEYLLKEGFTAKDGMVHREGIYHTTKAELPYENGLDSENFGAWLFDPVEGRAYVYVNTYFKPKGGYADYPEFAQDTTMLANLEATFKGMVKGYARVNGKPDDMDFEAGTFNADIELQAKAGNVAIAGTVDNFRGTHHDDWDRFVFSWNPANGDLMPSAGGGHAFGVSPREGTAGDDDVVAIPTSSLHFYRNTGQVPAADPAGIGGHLHMDFGDTGEAIGAFDAPKVP